MQVQAEFEEKHRGCGLPNMRVAGYFIAVVGGDMDPCSILLGPVRECGGDSNSVISGEQLQRDL